MASKTKVKAKKAPKEVDEEAQIIKNAPRQLWDQQPKESNKAYAAFVCYLQQGYTRSVRNVAKELHKSSTLIGQWSSKYSWVQRTSAFIEAQREEFEAMQDDVRAEIKQEHLELAKMMKDTVRRRIENIDPEELTATDAQKWLDVASKLSRLEIGESTERIDGNGTINVRDTSKAEKILNDSEASKLASELFAKLAGDPESSGVHAAGLGKDKPSGSGKTSQ